MPTISEAYKIDIELQQIRQVLRDNGTIIKPSSPGGVFPSYEQGKAKPWVISNQWHREEFSTSVEALEAAKAWRINP